MDILLGYNWYLQRGCIPFLVYMYLYTVNLLCSLSFDEIMDGLLLSKTCQYGEDVQITFTQQKDKTVYFKEIATVAFCVCI